MVETTRIRVAVLESQYASLEDHGVPLSVCLQLQQLGLQLHESQWTARHSLGGFSISFFWPALDNQQPVKKKKKSKKSKMNRKNASKPTTNQPPTSYLKPADVGSPAKSANPLDHSPIVAHHLPPESEPNLNDHSLHVSEAEPTPISEAEPTSISEAELTSTSTVPNLSDCEDVKYESRNYTPGVSYKTSQGKEQWTPVVRRKRTRQRVCDDTDSESSRSEVDVSCSRRVEFQKKDGVPGLNIYRRGPTVWTPIAFRTRSRTSKT